MEMINHSTFLSTSHAEEGRGGLEPVEGLLTTWEVVTVVFTGGSFSLNDGLRGLALVSCCLGLVVTIATDCSTSTPPFDLMSVRDLDLTMFRGAHGVWTKWGSNFTSPPPDSKERVNSRLTKQQFEYGNNFFLMNIVELHAFLLALVFFGPGSDVA